MIRFKEIATVGVVLSIVGVLVGCSTQGSLSNNKLFDSVPQKQKQELQSTIKVTGYKPELPTYYPYSITYVQAKANPGKAYPKMKQNITIMMGNNIHTLVEDVFFGKVGNISSEGSKTQLKDGTLAYFIGKKGSNSLSWKGKDGHSYEIDSTITPGSKKSGSTPSVLNEQQLVKVAESFK